MAAFGSFWDAIFCLLSEVQIWALVHSCRWGSGVASFKCHTAESASRGEAGRCAAMICGCHFCAQSPGCSLTEDHSSSTVHPGMAVLYLRSWGPLSLLNTFTFPAFMLSRVSVASAFMATPAAPASWGWGSHLCCPFPSRVTCSDGWNAAEGGGEASLAVFPESEEGQERLWEA